MGNPGPSFPRVRSSHPRVFGGIIKNYLLTPYSTRGGHLEPPKTGFFTKIIFLKQSNLLFSKNMSEVKKILNVILVEFIIFPGKLYLLQLF
jgi:hypothetical protein